MTRMLQSTRIAWLLSTTLAFGFSGLAAHAQQQQPVSPIHEPGAPAEASGFGNTNPNAHDPEQAHMMREMSKDRNALRQKEIVDDTNQMMDLIKSLKDDVDKSSKDQLSLTVVNTAAEIEKLAKSVKEKMRDGN